MFCFVIIIAFLILFEFTCRLAPKFAKPQTEKTYEFHRVVDEDKEYKRIAMECLARLEEDKKSKGAD